MNAWSFYTSKELSPRGWLQRQLEIQAQGLSGNLHKIWPDVRDSAWIGGDREGWERVPYWLDGFIPLAYLLNDDALIADAKKYVDAILASQQEDGWICPCPKNARAKYDTWAVQLISKTLKVYYDCSGDERIPRVLYRILKNYYDLLKSGGIKLFGWAKYRWFETFIALKFLYETYGEDWMKDLAKILKTQGYNYADAVPSWEKPRHLWLRKTHIVNLAMMLKSEAVSHELLGEDYTDEAERLRGILDRYNGTAFEGFTGDEVLSGLDPSRGTELCAVVEQMYSYEQLFARTGENKWAQRLEVLAFNALPATLSADMWTHQYVQMVNQIACQKTMIMAPFSTNGPRAHLFGLQPNYGCCTANFNQGWPKFALSAFMKKEDAVLCAVLLPCVLKDEGVKITLETNYPFENTARFTVDAEKEFTFTVRIPSFAKNLRVNGEASETKDVTFNITQGHTETGISPNSSRMIRRRSQVMASSKRTVTLSKPASVSFSRGSSRRSTSSETTLAARAASARVRTPAPGPISSTPCPSMPASCAMRGQTVSSTMKFCPSPLLRRKPCRAKSRVRYSRSVNSSISALLYGFSPDYSIASRERKEKLFDDKREKVW